MIYLRYLRSLLTHKWFVLLAGLKVGVPLWRLIVHDWSKFLPSEFVPYARYFYGGFTDRAAAKDDFDRAWLLHQNRNPHHWQFWILIYDEDGVKSLIIPETYIREMVADWMGASMAYTGSWEMHDWLDENWSNICAHLHSGTRVKLEMILAEHGYGNLPYVLQDTWTATG